MSKRPNILVIMADQHTPDVIGAYGNPHIHTPNLDRLCAEGVRFEHGYCNNPICVPSRMSFLTGQSTQQIEVWSLSDCLRSDSVTWPVLLGAAGYDTAMSGRMHMWWPDKHLGFHQRLCGDTQTRIAQGTFDLYEPGPARDAQLARFTEIFYRSFREGKFGIGPQKGFEEDREATERAAEYIRSRADNETPFALCVGYYCPHTPYCAPKEYFDRYADLDVEPTVLDETLPDFMKTFARHAGAEAPFDPEHQRNAVRAYYAMVDFIDELVGDLVQALEETGQLDNTMVVYTADHGDMLGRRGLWFKNQLLEPSIRPPFIVRGPAGLRSGEVEEAVVSLQDLCPTFADMAGAPTWEEITGDSLVPLLRGDDTAFADRPVFVEYADFGIGQPAACIRRRDLKLIRVRGYEPALFDLAVDPGETHNVYADSAYTDAVRQLEADLAEHWDAEDTWRRVIRNQNRIDLIRKSRNLAIARNAHQDVLPFDA